MPPYKYLESISALPSKETLIVDLGCGDGRVSKLFYDAGYRVLAVDKNEASLKEVAEAMPNADIRKSDILDVHIPDGAFIIVRNVLPFLPSKDVVTKFLTDNKNHAMYFTLFGPEDEKAKMALSWTRAEADALARAVSGIIWFRETKGIGTNLAGGRRQSHTYEFIRV